MIYNEVFGSSEVITPDWDEHTLGAWATQKGDHLLQPGATALYRKPPIDTSILATNREISEEAFVILYRRRIVRGNIPQLFELMRDENFIKHVRHIEIEDCAQGSSHMHFFRTLRLLQTLPLYCSIVILSDSLRFRDENSTIPLSVREFARVARLGKATCVAIGWFHFSGEFHDIPIVHRKLVKMWPSVVGTPKDYDVCVDVIALSEANHLDLWNSNVSAWAAQTSLRRWVAL